MTIMHQSQSLPDKLKGNSPLYDAIDTPSGSPYSRRYPITFYQNKNDDDANTQEVITVSESPMIFTFESPTGSPYTRRMPASEKKVRLVRDKKEISL